MVGDILKAYLVWHEKGGCIHVFADDEKDAVEKYYEAIEGVIGHQLETCKCFKDPKKFDRAKVLKPIRVEHIY